MKIVEIREQTLPIASSIRNAYIDFSKMTLSLVAVITDVIRDGKPVVGYGFNSNGRYGQGTLMRERFIPRVMEADPESLLSDKGDNLDPHKIWAAMMTNEKPGGHGERSVAVGTIDMAVWDAVAKIEGKPLFQLLADRYGNGQPGRKVFVYAAGGYYHPGQDHEALKNEMRSYIDRGYTVVKKKIGGASLDEDLRRIDSILSVLQDGQKLAVDANGRFDLDTAIQYAKALSQYDLFWYEEAGDPLDFELQATLRNYYDKPMATGENLFSMQDARNLIRHGGMRPDRDWLQFDCALHPARRPPDVAEHRGRPGPGRQRVLSGPVPAFRRLPGRREGGKRLRDDAGPAGHRLRGQVGPVQRDAEALGLTRLISFR
jgi:L-alanine-DL-glutamate epimerase-like enolase superfamily enzyme